LIGDDGWSIGWPELDRKSLAERTAGEVHSLENLAVREYTHYGSDPELDSAVGSTGPPQGPFLLPTGGQEDVIVGRLAVLVNNNVEDADVGEAGLEVDDISEQARPDRLISSAA